MRPADTPLAANYAQMARYSESCRMPSSGRFGYPEQCPPVEPGRSNLDGIAVSQPEPPRPRQIDKHLLSPYTGGCDPQLSAPRVEAAMGRGFEPDRCDLERSRRRRA